MMHFTILSSVDPIVLMANQIFITIMYYAQNLNNFPSDSGVYKFIEAMLKTETAHCHLTTITDIQNINL